MDTILVAKVMPGSAAGFEWTTPYEVVEIPYTLGLELLAIQDADFVFIDNTGDVEPEAQSEPETFSVEAEPEPEEEPKPERRKPGRPRKVPITEPDPDAQPA